MLCVTNSASNFGNTNRSRVGDISRERGNPNYLLLTAVHKHEDRVFNLESLSRPNPNPRDSDICRKPRHKSEVDLLNIVQLKLAVRREESQAR